MFLRYSPELIEETIACLQDEHNLILSSDEACQYLDSISGLFLAYAKTSKGYSSIIEPKISRVKEYPKGI